MLMWGRPGRRLVLTMHEPLPFSFNSWQSQQWWVWSRQLTVVSGVGAANSVSGVGGVNASSVNWFLSPTAFHDHLLSTIFNLASRWRLNTKYLHRILPYVILCIAKLSEDLLWISRALVWLTETINFHTEVVKLAFPLLAHYIKLLVFCFHY